jgi:Flp pilus assembly protein TadD
MALALGFAVLLDVLLAATFVWTAWLAPAVQTAGWLTLAAIWISAAWAAARTGDDHRTAPAEHAGEDLFQTAQTQYLQGNWFEAERTLERLLSADARDVEARLMLATLLRHTGRLDEAREHVKKLRRLEGAERWQQELDDESRRLAAAESPSAVENLPGQTAVAEAA